MSYKIYGYNQHHLQLAELAEVLPPAVPVIKVVDYKNAFLTPTNHLFVNHQYKPSGLITKFDDKQLTFFQQWYLYLKSRCLLKSNRRQGKFFWVHDLYTQNYYHWMCEALPRGYFLYRQHKQSKIIVPKEFHFASFIQASLNILNIEPEWVNAGESYTFEELITTDTVPNTGDIIPDLQIDLVNALLKGLKISKPGSAYKKIFLSRRKAKARKIVNEDSLLPYLKEMGYEIVYAEDLSFADQVELFASCSSLIALHGAGLTNLMFMPKDSKVLEIKNPDWRSQPLCFFQLANIFEVKWDYFNGETLGGRLTNHSDILVNENDFRRKLITFDSL